MRCFRRLRLSNCPALAAIKQAILGLARWAADFGCRVRHEQAPSGLLPLACLVHRYLPSDRASGL